MIIKSKIGADYVKTTPHIYTCTEHERYELFKTIKLDLSVKREKELIEVSFDSFTISDLDGTLNIYIDTPNEDKKLEINSCISIKVSAKKIYISNEPQDTFVNLWFFKLK